MIDREIVSTRLSRLREALRKLSKIAAVPLDDYLESETDRALAEHYLRLALEAMLDLGNHVIAEKGFRKPLALREIPLILAENGVLEKELAGRLSRAAGLRNRLVHGYADIDHVVIHGVLRKELADLETFAVVLGKLAGGERGS